MLVIRERNSSRVPRARGGSETSTSASRYREQRTLRFNYRLTDLQAALGTPQLALRAPAGNRHAYHLFVVRHRDGASARRRLYDRLRARGILTQVHYLPVYRHPWYE